MGLSSFHSQRITNLSAIIATLKFTHPYHIDEKELNVLKKAFYDFTKEDRDNQIKELQEKIAELQK